MYREKGDKWREPSEEAKPPIYSIRYKGIFVILSYTWLS